MKSLNTLQTSLGKIICQIWKYFTILNKIYMDENTNEENKQFIVN